MCLPRRSALFPGAKGGSGRLACVQGPQAVLVAAVPGAAALGLVPPRGAALLPATLLADEDWTASRMASGAVARGTDDRRVLATLWWYSASSVLLAPALAGLVTGVPLSARLPDTTLAALPGGLLIAAVSAAAGPASPEAAGAQLRESLAPVIGAVARAGRMRERPLWAIAPDSLANRLLDVGRSVGDVAGATALAGPLAGAVGPPLPAPRYVDVGGARFTRRSSCCLLYRVPGGPLCTSCPRRRPEERRALLEAAAHF